MHGNLSLPAMPIAASIWICCGKALPCFYCPPSGAPGTNLTRFKPISQDGAINLERRSCWRESFRELQSILLLTE
jgi:hypothetical protein